MNGDFGYLRNITLQNTSYEHSWAGSSAGALYIKGSLLEGIDGAKLLNNAGSAVQIDGSLLGGITDTEATGNFAYKNFGGAIGIQGDLMGGITDSVFSDNKLVRDPDTATGIGTSHYGGAVGISGTLYGGINSTQFIDNKAYAEYENGGSYSGGALSAKRIEGGITDSTFSGNVSGTYSGALALPSSSITTGILKGGIHNTVFSGNTAGTQGGAIYAAGGAVGGTEGLDGGIYDSTFSENKAGTTGGAIIALYLNDGIHQTVFSANEASQYGGAIAILRSLNGGIERSTFSGNSVSGGTGTAFGLGGAIFTRGDFSVSDSTFENNTASTANIGDLTGGRGGAIFHDGNLATSTVELKSTDPDNPLLFTGNTQDPGGTGVVRNSIYFGTTLTTGTAVTTNVTIDAAEETSVLMFDPLASQESGMLNAATGTAYNDLTVNVTKTGSGSWVLSGFNDMRSAGAWNINAGELYLASGNSDEFTPTVIDLSADGSSFTLKSGAELWLELGAEPHQINAENILLEDGSSGVRGAYGENFVTWASVPTEPIPVLKLTADELLNEQAVTQLSGELKIGVANYAYELTWGGTDNDTLYLTVDSLNGVFDPERAGVAAISAPGIIVYRNQINNTLFKRGAEQFRGLRGGLPLAENLWVKPVYDTVRQTAGGGRTGYKMDSSGIATGYDLRINDKLFAGIAFNAEYPDLDGSFEEVTAKDYTGAVYAGFALPNNLDLFVFGAYGKGGYQQTRRVDDYYYRADYDAEHFRAGAEISRIFRLNQQASLRPFISYEYFKAKVDGYNEGSGPYALAVRGFDQDINRLRIGGEYSWSDDKDRWLGVQLYYANLLSGRRANADISFTQDSAGTTYGIAGDALDKHSIGLGISGRVPLSERTILSGAYLWEKGAHLTGQQFTLDVQFTW